MPPRSVMPCNVQITAYKQVCVTPKDYIDQEGVM